MDKFLSLPVEKQNKVIDAALASFGTNGYKKTSASDIAAAAGISKAMVFHYFGTKKDLYLYLINYCYKLISTAIDEKFDSSVTDFFDRIQLSSDIKLSVLYKHPASMSFLTSAYFETDPEVKGAINDLLSRSEGFRNKIMFEGMDTTKFKAGVNPHLVLKILLWMAEGSINSMNLKDFTQEDMDNFLEEYYEGMNLLKNNFYKEEYL